MCHRNQIFSQILTEQDFFTFSIYYLTLLVHYVVILEYIFSYREVLAFHLLLSVFYLLRYHLGFDSFVFLHAQPLDDGLHPLSAEESHQIIFHGNAELSLSRVSLTSGTTSQLVIYSP